MSKIYSLQKFRLLVVARHVVLGCESLRMRPSEAEGGLTGGVQSGVKTPGASWAYLLSSSKMFDYLFAVCLCFAVLAAYNIGANDVSKYVACFRYVPQKKLSSFSSWATTVASRSLTLRQACFLAAIFEFLGAMLVGARVAATLKTGIVSPVAFDNNPGVQMLASTCALVAAGVWQMIATAKAWPVSSSYSIVSALMGAGVALDHRAVNWGWGGGNGLAVIWAGMGVAPLVAALFASAIYLFTKYAVLVRSDSLRCGLWVSPVYFFTVAAVVTMSIGAARYMKPCHRY